MQKLFTQSAYETSAEAFFDNILKNQADLVLDVRLKNSSQLCGFTKKRDLEYLISKLAGAVYIHDPRFAPTSEMLDRYLKHWISWDKYAEQYTQLMDQRNILSVFQNNYSSFKNICILGTATKKRRSHSEILIRLLDQEGNKK